MNLPLEDLEVYQISEKLADAIWDVCICWEYFAKDTVGKQLVKAADSIGANIAEGYGRYSYKENIQFCYYARGSMFETRHWLRRAQKRKFLTTSQVKELKEILKPLPVKLNAYIKSIKLQQSKPK